MPKESEPASPRRLPRLYAPERDPDPETRRWHILWEIISACGMLRKRYKHALEAKYRAGKALARRESERNKDRYESAEETADQYTAYNRKMLRDLNAILPGTFKKLREIVVVNEDIEDWDRAEGEWVVIESDAGAAMVARPNKLAVAAGTLQSEGSAATVDTPTTLDEFMTVFCTPLSKNLRDSRRQSLQSAARRGVIRLPESEGKWKRGQSKKYRPSALMKAWPKYRQDLPNLPELKPIRRSS